MRLLRDLAAGQHRITAVVCSPDSGSSGRPGMWSLAQGLRLRTWPAESVIAPGFARRVESDSVDLLLNAHSLHVLPGEVIDAVKIGCFNLHPGPLPEYAGLNAPSWAIFNGEKTHRVTVHKMESKIDTGPVVYSAAFEIGKDDSALTVFGSCVKLGVPLLLKLVEKASHDPSGLPMTPQDLTRRRYFGRDVPNDGWISWSGSARQIVNFVRACDYHPFLSPWGHPKTCLEGREIGIVRARAIDESPARAPGTVLASADREAKIACSEGVVLASHAVSDGSLFPAAQLLQPGQRLTGPGPS